MINVNNRKIIFNYFRHLQWYIIEFKINTLITVTHSTHNIQRISIHLLTFFSSLLLIKLHRNYL